MRPGWRSLLFVPANDHRRLATVATRRADAVILDLEDGVAASGKAAARSSIAAAIDTLSRQGCTVVVRTNADWRNAAADLAVAVVAGVSAVMVPKVEDPARLSVLATMIREIAADRSPPGVIALIESPRGLLAAPAIAQLDGVTGLALGSEDFALAMGVPPTPDLLDMPCRMLCLAAASCRLMALAVPISIGRLADGPGWQAAVDRARAFGATGALCIHPAQVAAANAGFGPSPAEVEDARTVVAAWHAQDGGVVRVNGKMVDEPVYRAAAALLRHLRAPLAPV